jgi:periplasmic copper chaperone A
MIAMHRPFFTAIALTAAGLSLVACSEGADPAPAAEEGKVPGLEVSNARMMLAPVAGNPAAIYFDVSYDGDRNIAIRRADVANAGSAQLHDMMEYDFEMTMGEMPPLMLQPGDKISFEPGGKHVMAFDVSPELAPGDMTEVTLTVAGGKTHSFEVPVQAPDEER